MLDASTKKTEELEGQLEEITEENQRLKDMFQSQEPPAAPSNFPARDSSNDEEDSRNYEAEIKSLNLEKEKLQAEVKTLSSKNKGLQETVDQLTDQLDSFRSGADTDQVAELTQELQKKDLEIERLKSKPPLPSNLPTNDDEVIDLRSKVANQEDRIHSLVEEVQNLMAAKIPLEQEIAELKMKSMERKESSVILPSDFDVERELNSLKAQIIAREQRIEEMTKQVAQQNNRIASLQIERNKLAQDIKDEEDRKAEKKRKTWWGGKKKKKKPKKGDMPAQDEEDSDFSVPSNATHMEPVGEFDVPASERQPKDMKVMRKEIAALNKRNLELERENAKQEGEIKIMEKEKLAVMDQNSRIESQNEVLKKQNRDINLRNPKSISVPRAVAVPIPEDGGSEIDKLRMTVQLQDAALREVAIQKEQLNDQLDTYEATHRDYDAKHFKETEVLKSEVRETNNKFLNNRVQTKLTEESLSEVRDKQRALEIENNKLHEQLMEALDLKDQTVEKYEERIEVYSALLGESLGEKNDLRAETLEIETQRAKDLSTYKGEIRSLREGRIRRMEGEIPTEPVFPSPAGSGKGASLDPPNLSRNREVKKEVPVIKEIVKKDSSSVPSTPSELRYGYTPDRGYVLQASDKKKKDPIRTHVTVKTKEQGENYAPFPAEDGLGESNPWTQAENEEVLRLTASSEDRKLAKSVLNSYLEEQKEGKPIAPTWSEQMRSSKNESPSKMTKRQGTQYTRTATLKPNYSQVANNTAGSRRSLLDGCVDLCETPNVQGLCSSPKRTSPATDPIYYSSAVRPPSTRLPDFPEDSTFEYQQRRVSDMNGHRRMSNKLNRPAGDYKHATSEDSMPRFNLPLPTDDRRHAPTYETPRFEETTSVIPALPLLEDIIADSNPSVAGTNSSQHQPRRESPEVLPQFPSAMQRKGTYPGKIPSFSSRSSSAAESPARNPEAEEGEEEVDPLKAMFGYRPQNRQDSAEGRTDTLGASFDFNF